MIDPSKNLEAGKTVVSIAKSDERPAPSREMTVPATRHPIGTLHVYEVTGEELTVIETANFLRTFYTLFIGIGASAAASFGLCLATVPIANAYLFATFVATVMVSVLIFIVFTVLWFRVEHQIVVTRQRILGAGR